MTDDRRVREIVVHAATASPFYARRYADAGVDPRAIRGAADLPKLPIVEPSDLIECGEEFRARTETPYRVSSSSGTLTKPKTLYRTRADTQASVEVMCRLFEMAELERGDRLMIGQPFDLSHIGYLALDACARLGILAIPSGLAVTDERAIGLLDSFRPTAVFTSPSRMSVITEVMQATGAEPRTNLRSILLAGEPCSARQRQVLGRYWNAKVFDLYGSEETDGLGGSCREGSGIHFIDDQFVLEVLDLETGRAVADGEVGQAVVTSLYSRGTPLIRYRLGDLVQRTAAACVCGRPWPVVRLHGRSDDVLFLYEGVKLRAYQVASAIEAVAPHAQGFQVVCRVAQPGREELQVVVDAPESASSELGARLREAVWQSSLDLDAARRMGSLDIRVLFGRERMHVTPRGKTPRIWDLRPGA